MAMDGKNPGENPEKTVSLWEIERLLLGEIQGSEAEALHRRIADTPDLKAYMERVQDQGPRRTFADFQRLKRERAAVPQAVDKHKGRNAGSALWEWLAGLARPLPGPRLAYGMAFAALVGVTVYLYPSFHPDQQTAVMDGPYQAKGGDDLEILLKVAGEEVETGESQEAQAGDTLAFSYRSPKSRHVSIWYREDGGALMPFADPSHVAAPWDAATRWTPAPQRILLEGSWKHQEVWVVSGARPLSPDEVKALVEGRKGSDKLGKTYLFRLVQENKTL